MMKRFLAFALCVIVLHAGAVYAQVQEKIDIKIGAGTTLSPTGVLGVGSADYRLSENIALTAMMQWSLGELQDIVFPSFGGRLILPRSVINGSASGNSGLELSALFGAGPVYREVNGFKASHVGYTTGIGVDMFLGSGFSFGGTALVNFTSNVVEDSFFSVFGHVGLHF
ncbi:MAG TPA: hypothetical protein PKC21_00120 [Oligoflexia bacterium]|nr:hypothetical protein [Oligoflexia bacterium]HMR23731.1 hypothetical protein [Oligoflexia bacterium]